MDSYLTEKESNFIDSIPISSSEKAFLKNLWSTNKGLDDVDLGIKEKFGFFNTATKPVVFIVMFWVVINPNMIPLGNIFSYLLITLSSIYLLAYIATVGLIIFYVRGINTGRLGPEVLLRRELVISTFKSDYKKISLSAIVFVITVASVYFAGFKFAAMIWVLMNIVSLTLSIGTRIYIKRFLKNVVINKYENSFNS